MDIVNKARRSENMRRIRSRDTKPEMVVRRTAFGLGYRYRLHQKTLPGSPDLVFPKLRTTLFVHGCFWHRHKGCPNCTSPSTRPEFWEKKFAGNMARDRRNVSALKRLGWRVAIIWECETTDLNALARRLQRLLGSEVGSK
jgi:DNA mismatch endonuclease (patch repair protein)